MRHLASFILVLCFSWSQYTYMYAQENPEVFYFSRATGSFDRGNLPIGEDFQIKGVITADIQAVKIESFGFTGDIPANLQNLTDKTTFCTEVIAQRGRSNRSGPNSVVHATLAWERPDTETTPSKEFTVNHDQLYYGRKYVFLITYYQTVNVDNLKSLAKAAAEAFYKKITNEYLNTPGLNRDELGKLFTDFQGEINELTLGEQNGACDNKFVEEFTFKPVQPADFMEIDKFRDAIAADQAKIQANIYLRKAQAAFSQNNSIQTFENEVTERIKKMREANDAKDWSTISTERVALLQIFKSGQPWHALVEKIKTAGLDLPNTNANEELAKQNAIKTQINAFENSAVTGLLTPLKANIKNNVLQPGAVGNLVTIITNVDDTYSQRSELNNLRGILIDINFGRTNGGDISENKLIDDIVAKIKFSHVGRVLSSTSSIPYFQTTASSYPFIISLDGGLAYVGRFGEITPTIGINFKVFGRRDFDDPLDTRPEWSMIVGITTTEPDDLDPEYRGMFKDTGKSALLVGVGVRLPRFSRIIRFQGGITLYKQANSNPLIDDANTKCTVYGGISVNWDTLDFIKNLFNNRSDFTINK